MIPLYVTKNQQGKEEFEMRDYSLAERVELISYNTYGVNYHLIRRIHYVKTEQG